MRNGRLINTCSCVYIIVLHLLPIAILSSIKCSTCSLVHTVPLATDKRFILNCWLKVDLKLHLHYYLFYYLAKSTPCMVQRNINNDGRHQTRAAGYFFAMCKITVTRHVRNSCLRSWDSYGGLLDDSMSKGVWMC